MLINPRFLTTSLLDVNKITSNPLDVDIFLIINNKLCVVKG